MEKNDEKVFDINDFLLLLNLLYQVAQSLKGKIISDSRLVDVEKLAAKLFFHCSSIYWLRQGTKVPYPKPKGADFYDFASVAVLSRTALETYLTMFEVFFEPITDDEKEYRHALWLLSGLILREKYAPTMGEFEQEYKDAREEIQKIKERLERTQAFQKLTPKQQKQALQGKRQRDWERVAKSAGFGERTIRQIYAYLSSYAHADGLLQRKLK